MQKALDPVTLEVIYHRLTSIAEEMQLSLLKSSFSAIIKEVHDAVSTIFDGKGQNIAQAAGVPVHLCNMMTSVPKFLEAFALHLVDDLDAKINGLGRFMEKDRHEGAWTDFNRLFGRHFLKGKIPSAESVEEETAERDEPDDRQGFLFSLGSD